MAAYATGVNIGIYSPNDVRRLEDMNPREGGDEYKQLNATPEPFAQPAPEPAPAPEPVPQRGALRAGHYQMLLQEAATRVVRREVAALSKAARRCCDDAAAWQAAVDEFCGEHAGYVAQSLRVGHLEAEAYVAQLRAALLAQGATALEQENERTAYLVGLVLEGENEC